MTDDRILTTQSSWRAFKTCQKKHDLRYNRQLVPTRADDAAALHYGKLWDRLLNVHYLSRVHDADATIAAAGEWRTQLQVMFTSYRQATAIDDAKYETVAMQVPFEGDIVNPDTDSPSKTFTLAGVVDGLWRSLADNRLWIVENKTTSRCDAAYLERLWMDWQILLYTEYLQREHGPIAGVIYNIAEKPGIKRAEAETDGEFEARKQAAKAPDRIKRKVADTEETWGDRLREHYAERTEKFHREVILFDRSDLDEVRADLWSLSQTWLDARRRGHWFKNTAACFEWNRPCDYLAVCRSKENPIVIETQYRVEPPHGEYREAVKEASHVRG